MDSIRTEVAENVGLILIDNPPVNAISDKEMFDIKCAFEELGERKDVRAVVFSGTGEKAFCGGVNLKTLDNRGSPNLSWSMDLGKGFREACWSVYDCPVPVIGAINGAAVGAGLALASVCDILIATDKASFATTEINVGLLGAYTHLKMLVGRYKARELFFSGEFISSRKLLEIGAVSRVVKQEELLPTAMQIAGQLAKKSPYAIRLAKEAMNVCEHMPLKQAYHTEQHYTERLRQYQDSNEARDAYFEKRDPRWEWDYPEAH